jgi:parvulin-like peptidyl-prolyl isomerase
MNALEVNGVRIDAQAIRAESARLRQEALSNGDKVFLEDTLRFSDQAEELLIERVLLDREAARLGIAVRSDEVDSALARFLPRTVTACRTDPHSAEIRADIERRLRIDKLVDLWTKSVKPPSAKQVREVYRRQRDLLHVPERLCVAQIVENLHHDGDREPARTALEGVARELAGGASFSALAAAHSDCPEAGGVIGLIARGQMVPEFDDVVFSLDLHKPSSVFETRFGFHIALVTERRPAGPLDFAEAAPQIENALMDQAKEVALNAHLKNLHSRATVRRVFR